MAYDGPFPITVSDGGTGDSSLTAHDVLVGAGTSPVVSISPSATSGVPLVSQGSSSDPHFGTAVVAGGGTGDTSFTPYCVLCAGTTSTGNLQSVASVGSSGNVLTSNGSGSLPTFQGVPSASITVDGDTGSAAGSTITFSAKGTLGSSTSFSASGTTVDLNATDADSNTLIGMNAGNGSYSGSFNTSLGSGTLTALTSGSGNTAVGYTALNSATSVQYNTAVGYQSLMHNQTGGQNTAVGYNSLLTSTGGSINTAVGYSALQNLTSGSGNTSVGYIAGEAITTGLDNTAIGESSLSSLTTGSFNVAIGQGAGSNYTSSESSNILLGNEGTVSESNVIRIGTQGSGSAQQDKCFMAGITGSTPTSGNTPQVVLCDNAGNLATISSGTSGYVLTSNGSSTPSFQASSGGSGALVLIQTQTISSAVSAVSFTSGISSTYNNYLLMISNLRSTGGFTVEIQLSTNGGSSYVNTGYLSGINLWNYNSSTAAINYTSSTSLALSLEYGTVRYIEGSANLFNLTKTGPIAMYGEVLQNDLSGNVGSIVSQGYNNLSTAVNAIQIFTATNTFDIGTFSLYGYSQ